MTPVDRDGFGFVLGRENAPWRRTTENTALKAVVVKAIDSTTPVLASDLWATLGEGVRVRTIWSNNVVQANWANHFEITCRSAGFGAKVTGPFGLVAETTILGPPYTPGNFGLFGYAQKNLRFGPITYPRPKVKVHPDIQPPTVEAGPDQALELPSNTLTQGTVTEDGFFFVGCPHDRLGEVERSGPPQHEEGTVNFIEGHAAKAPRQCQVAKRRTVTLSQCKVWASCERGRCGRRGSGGLSKARVEEVATTLMRQQQAVVPSVVRLTPSDG